jgi:hypothetical protein
MGIIISNLETITGQTNLSSGVNNINDAELLVMTLPQTTKESLLRNSGLDVGTSDSQLTNLIYQQEVEGIVEPTVEIEPIDVEGIKPFEDDREGQGVGQSQIDDDLEQLLNNPDFKGDGDGEDSDDDGQGGSGSGDDSDDDNDDDGQGGNGSGSGDDSDDGEDESGNGGSPPPFDPSKFEEQSEEEKLQEKIENELLQFGYQPPYFYLTQEVLSAGSKGVKEELEYVTIYKSFEKTDGVTFFEISIKPKNDAFESLKLSATFKTDVIVITCAYEDKNKDGKTLYSKYIESQKATLSNLFNKAYSEAVNEFNQQLIKEAEKNQQFIENINN